MGYTHYWRQLRDFTDTEWQELTRLTNLIIADNEGILSAGFGEGGKPEVNGEHIWFNGLGEDSHETFRITKKKRAKEDYEEQEAYDRRGAFEFCKTAHKPYDKYVVAVLCALYNLSNVPPQRNRNAHPMREITSDGNTKDWTEGLFHAVRSTRKDEMYCPIRDCLTLSYVDYIDREKKTG